MTLRFLPEAEAELRAAAQVYADVRMELAERFLDSIAAAQREIAVRPLRFPVPVHIRTTRQIRRALVNGFPYALIYEVRERELLVLAVSHVSRRPGYWKKRG